MAKFTVPCRRSINLETPAKNRIPKFLYSQVTHYPNNQPNNFITKNIPKPKRNILNKTYPHPNAPAAAPAIAFSPLSPSFEEK